MIWPDMSIFFVYRRNRIQTPLPAAKNPRLLIRDMIWMRVVLGMCAIRLACSGHRIRTVSVDRGSVVAGLPDSAMLARCWGSPHSMSKATGTGCEFILLDKLERRC